MSLDDIKANEELSNGLLDRLIVKAEAISESTTLSKDAKEEATLQVGRDAVALYNEAVLAKANGGFRPFESIKLKFRVDGLIEPQLLVQEAAKKGLFFRVSEIASFILSPFSAETTRRRNIAAIAKAGLDFRVPNAIISGEIGDMFLGRGTFGGLSSADKASMELFLIVEARKFDGSSGPLPTEEAHAMAEKIVVSAQKRFLSEEKRLSGEAAEQVGALIFKSGKPATEARQQPLVSGIADSIRKSLANGKTISEVEEFMQGEPGFTQEAFDRAAAIVQVAQ